jgi:uncharacterized protein (DUF2267 family)
VDYLGFTALVEQAAGIDREAAERAIRAVLQTLGERLGGRAARALAEHLPPEVRPWLDAAPTAGDARSGVCGGQARQSGTAQPFGADEFVRRVAERARVDPPTAEYCTTAVYTALRQALDGSGYQL